MARKQVSPLLAVSPFQIPDAAKRTVPVGGEVQVHVVKGEYLLLEARLGSEKAFKTRAIRIFGPMTEPLAEEVVLDSQSYCLAVHLDNPGVCRDGDKIRIVHRPLGVHQPFEAYAEVEVEQGRQLYQVSGLPSGEYQVFAPGATSQDRPPFVAFTMIGNPGSRSEASVSIKSPGTRTAVTLRTVVAGNSDTIGRIFVERVQGGAWLRLPLREGLRRGLQEHLIHLPVGSYRFGVIPLGSFKLEGQLVEEGFVCDGSSMLDITIPLNVSTPGSTARLTLKGIGPQHFPARVLFYPEGEPIRASSIEDNFIGRYAWTSHEGAVPPGLGRGRVVVLGHRGVWTSSTLVHLGASSQGIDMVPATCLELISRNQQQNAAVRCHVTHPLGSEHIVLASTASPNGPRRCKLIVPRGRVQVLLASDDTEAGVEAKNNGMWIRSIDADQPIQQVELD